MPSDAPLVCHEKIDRWLVTYPMLSPCFPQSGMYSSDEDSDDNMTQKLKKEQSMKDANDARGKYCPVIYPTGPFRCRWDIVQMIVLLYITFIVPYRVALEVTSYGYVVSGILVNIRCWHQTSLHPTGLHTWLSHFSHFTKT